MDAKFTSAQDSTKGNAPLLVLEQPRAFIGCYQLKLVKAFLSQAGSSSPLIDAAPKKMRVTSGCCVRIARSKRATDSLTSRAEIVLRKRSSMARSTSCAPRYNV